MKIIIACGGTGGHIYPGLSLYLALRKRLADSDIILVTDKRAISSSIVTPEFNYILLPFVRIRFKFNLHEIVIVLKLLEGVFKCLRILLFSRPDIVVGFGGYASFFLVFFASLFRIKTIIHEQNIRPGQANSILAFFVNKIAISFSQSRDYFGFNYHKVKLTGNPLRPNLARVEKQYAREFFGLPPNKFTILVSGGSQGAHKINIIIPRAISLIKDKVRFQVIHLCGDKDYLYLTNLYKELDIEARVFAFLDKMEYAYSAADIIVSRSGAATINEIIFFGLASIIIPYPYARSHQIDNARYLFKNKAALFIEEGRLNAEILKNKILQLFGDVRLRESIGNNVLSLMRTDADNALANVVLE